MESLSRGVPLTGDSMTNPAHDSDGGALRSRLSARQRVIALTAVVFVAVMLLSSPVPGINEPHYLCKARAAIDPSWCAPDFFLHSTNAHVVFLTATGWLTQWFPLAVVAAAGRVVSAGLLACGWQRLAHSVGLAPAFQLLAAAGLATLVQLGSFSGEWLLGGFEAKVPAWAFCMLALAVWIEPAPGSELRRAARAGFRSGLACLLHPVVGGWVAVCIVLAEVPRGLRDPEFRLRRTRLRSVAARVAVFGAVTLLLSLPGVLPALQLLRDESVSAAERDMASFVQVFGRLSHHLDPTVLSPQQWGFAGVLLAVIVICRCWPATRDTRRSPGLDALLWVLCVAMLIAVAGIRIGWHTAEPHKLPDWAWRARLLKFYWFRTFDALLPVVTVLSVAAMLQSRIAIRRRWNLLMVVPALVAVTMRPAAPPGYSPQQFADWKDACRWIRENTSADALVLTPRESFGFKWFAERAEFVCYKDCPQDAKGILTWNRRLWQIHDWSKTCSADGRYSDDDLHRLRQETGCHLLLTRVLGPFESQPVAQFGEWQVVRLPDS
jgi:hypothetical protein